MSSAVSGLRAWLLSAVCIAAAAMPMRVQTSSLSAADRDFLVAVAEAGHAEIEAGRLAQTQSAREDVREFAREMVDDHLRIAGTLELVARPKGVTLPAQPSAAQQARLRKLRDARGDAFDRLYADEIAYRMHRDLVRRFLAATRDARDVDVRAFAENVLPAVQHHLAMGESLKTAVLGRDRAVVDARAAAGAAPR